MNEESTINKWCIAHVFMTFKKLKGACKTESGKKSIMAGEWFMPLSEDIQFKWLSLSTPKALFHVATESEVSEHFKTKKN